MSHKDSVRQCFRLATAKHEDLHPILSAWPHELEQSLCIFFSPPQLPKRDDRREILLEEVLPCSSCFFPFFSSSDVITHSLLQLRFDGGRTIVLHVLRRILDFASTCSRRVRSGVCTSEHQSDMTSYLHWLPEMKAPGSVTQASITSESR